MDRKIAKNYFYSAAYRVLIVILPLITTPYVSRVLKPEGIGVVSYTSSIAAAFTLVAALGFAAYGQREIAYHQDDIQSRSVVFFEIGFFRAVTTLVATVVYIVFCFVYKEYTLYLLPQCLSVISVMFDISWYFQGMENFRITVIRNAVVRIASIACIFLFVKKPTDLFLYIFIISASNLISNLFYYLNLHQHVVKVPLSELRPLRHVRGTIEFFIPLIAVEIYSHLDRIMLGYMMPTTVESGYYEQARKITSLVVGLIVSINSVMMPRIANLYVKNEKSSIISFYRKTFNILLMIMLPACIGLILISDNFVLWFFGTEYVKVSTLIKLSALLIVFMCIGNFAGIQYLSPTGQQNKMTAAYVVAAVTNIALNAYMIPRFASVGALVASIIAELISCGIQMLLLLKSEYSFRLVKGSWKYLIATAGMAFTIILVHFLVKVRGPLGTGVDVVFGGLVYYALLLLVKEETAKDLFRRYSVNTAMKNGTWRSRK